MTDDEPIPTGLHPKTRQVPTLTPPIDACFEDEMTSGDDDEDNLISGRNFAKQSDIKGVGNGHFDLQVRLPMHRLYPG